MMTPAQACIFKEIDMGIEKMKHIAAGVSAIALAACGSTYGPASPSSGPVPVTSSTTSSMSGYGVIQSIEAVPTGQTGGGVGLGTVAGAVVGGVLGNQVGSGRGRTAATVAGAAGGALAGGQMQRNSQAASQGQAYRVTVRMDNGAMQTLLQDNPPNLQIGERVRVSNGVIVERLR
jgi:outer membrane lipoprotein SlyB